MFRFTTANSSSPQGTLRFALQAAIALRRMSEEFGTSDEYAAELRSMAALMQTVADGHVTLTFTENA